MTISIDIDNTWTADRLTFRALALFFRDRGHQVIITTNRTGPTDDMWRFDIPDWIPIVYAGKQLKEAAALAAGYKVDIWIDDTPGTIQECKYLKDQESVEL